MGTKRVGGRPRNAWTSSRRRKLVRLYTLSTLNKSEIRNILQDHDFKPSMRDLEKNLGRLLTSDYTKCYRSFRPSDEKNMRLRLSGIRRWRNGKIAPRSYRRNGELVSRMCTSQIVGGSSDTTLLVPSKTMPTIDPALLQTSAQETDNSRMNGMDLSESEEHMACEENDFNIVKEERGEEELDAGKDIESVHLEFHPAQLTLPGHEHTSKPPLPQHLTEIGRRLGGLRSRSYISCINSLLRYSSTNSWRSSISSFMSHLSSTKSKYSIEIDIASPTEGVDKDSQAYDKRLRTTEALSQSEQMIWKELVDEDQLTQEIVTAPSHPSAMLRLRTCCRLDFQPQDIKGTSAPLCDICGFSAEHMLQVPELWSKGPFLARFPGDINKRDMFGNTPLHYLAVSDAFCLRRVYCLVEKGADPNARNAAGESFMHVLNMDRYRQSQDLDDYLQVLTYLRCKGFWLHKSDFHGRTVRDKFILDTEGVVSGHRGEILSLMGPVRGLDNIVRKFHDEYLNLSLKDFESCCRFFCELEDQMKAGKGYSFRTLLQKISWSARENISDIILIFSCFSAFITYTDSSGDSLLISVLKSCPNDVSDMDLRFYVIEAVRFGVEIETRDRAGDSVLAIACYKGFRPVVTALLSGGANIHVRNLKGQGILSQCRQYMLRAHRESDDKLYARILSCMNVIIDAGGKLEPTEIDEWTLRPEGMNGIYL